MTERRSRRKKREDEESEDEENEPSDEQTEIAKHLRFNCETKSSNYKSQKVEYFKGSKAIDCLLDSKWASGKGGAEILFTDRESVQDYLEDLLELGMFKRVTRVRKKKKGDKDEGKKSAKDSPKPSKSKKEKETNESKNGESDGKKMKVKVKLELHDKQDFLDGDEQVYMWIFDPVHPRTIIYGVLVLIAAVVICLFPLWPVWMREYTWYLSVVAAVLLGALIVVALFRYVLFAFVWGITAGRYHFWLLPNLTEDCGFFESFKPLYTQSYMGTEGEEDVKTEETEDKDANNGTLEEKQELGVEDVIIRDTKDEEDKDKDTKGPSEQKQRKSSSTTSKETNETESWIKVTQEDVAQAKEATGDESNIETMTSPVSC